MPDRFDKFSERARRTLTLAQEEAQRFNHNYIGTEHLLLGLVREGEGVAAGVLESLGVTTERARSETLRILSELGGSGAGAELVSGGTIEQRILPAESRALAILLERLRQAKDAAIAAQQYEVAAALRVQEVAILEALQQEAVKRRKPPEQTAGE